MKSLFGFAAAMVVLSFTFSLHASELDSGWEMLSSGQAAQAAEFFSKYAESNPSGTSASEALAMCARILDSLADSFTGNAEKKCYWTKKGGAACMQKETSDLNVRFGQGAFIYELASNYISYTGLHYRKIKELFPNTGFASEAYFYFLLKDLVGPKEKVLEKVKAFIEKNPKGQWNRKGLLLLARVNEDLWFITRNRSLILINDEISPDELVVRAEPYRQEALKIYQKLMKEKGTFEADAAKREFDNLKNNRDDGVLYGIVADSAPGTLSKWGVDVPKVVSATMEGEPAVGKQTGAEKAEPADVPDEQNEKKPKKKKKSRTPNIKMD